VKDIGLILSNVPLTLMYNSTNYKSCEQTLNWIQYTLMRPFYVRAARKVAHNHALTPA